MENPPPPSSSRAVRRKETAAGIPPSVGQVVHRLRRDNSLTLEELARRSGVSKSMLSQIERNRTNPTFATVWRLTNALGVGLDDVFRGDNRETAVDIVAAHATPTVTSADGKCLLRILGPLDLAGSAEWYELTAGPGAELVSEAHESGTTEHLSVFEGTLVVESGENSNPVGPGETARYAADQAHAVRNAGKKPARALMVVVLGRQSME